MPPTVEQLGTSFYTLRLQIYCVDLEIHWAMKNKVLLSYLTHRLPVSRYPDVHSMHAARIVHGMAVNLANLASHLYTHPVLFISNCAHVLWEFVHKSYPHSWWMPVMKHIYESLTPTPIPSHCQIWMIETLTSPLFDMVLCAQVEKILKPLWIRLPRAVPCLFYGMDLLQRKGGLCGTALIKEICPIFLLNLDETKTSTSDRNPLLRCMTIPGSLVGGKIFLLKYAVCNYHCGAIHGHPALLSIGTLMTPGVWG